MAIIQFGFDYTKGNQILKVELDGAVYGLKFLWNTRMQSWTMEVQKADGTVLVSGVHVTADYSLLSRFTHVDLPPGRLFCLDVENSGNTPNATNLGVSFQFAYEEA